MGEGEKTLYEKTRRATVSYIRGKEADIDTGLKNLERKWNRAGSDLKIEFRFSN